MGLHHHFSSGKCESAGSTVVVEKERVVEKPVYVLPNPDPKNFNVLMERSVGRFLVLYVRYPQCTNYEGNKILVFKDVTLGELKAQGLIDPHFSQDEVIHSPIARFEPTKRGWEWALAFAQSQEKK